MSEQSEAAQGKYDLENRSEALTQHSLVRPTLWSEGGTTSSAATRAQAAVASIPLPDSVLRNTSDGSGAAGGVKVEDSTDRTCRPDLLNTGASVAAQKRFEELYRRYHRLVRLMASDWGRANFTASEEITSEAWICIWKQMLKCAERPVCKRWLRGIVRSAAVDYFRKQAPQGRMQRTLARVARAVSDRENAARMGEFEQSVERSREIREAIRVAVLSLSPRQRVIVGRCFIDGASQHEVALELRVSQQTVSRLKRKALRHLARIIDPSIAHDYGRIVGRSARRPGSDEQFDWTAKHNPAWAAVIAAHGATAWRNACGGRAFATVN